MSSAVTSRSFIPPAPRSAWQVAADLFDPPVDPYTDDPAGWARDILGIHLWSRQREIAESVRDHSRTAVRSGHGVGKTLTAAVVALWFLDTHLNSRVITTATKWSQVEKLLWHEINQLIKRARHRPEAATRPMMRGTALSTEMRMADGRYAIGLSSKPENSESFAGHHAPNILVIYDEGSGVHRSIFEVGEGYMTTDGARSLLIGNPTRTTGEFFDAFHSKRADYNTLHISAMESPAITGEPVPDDARAALTGKAWVESRRRAWGEDSPMFQIRVLGNFAKSSTNAVMDLGQVEDAQDRATQPGYPVPQALAVVSCDVARFGDDESVISTRHDRQIRIRDTWMGKRPPKTATGAQVGDTEATAGRVVHWWKILRDECGADPVIVIDDAGVGGGVTDILRNEGLVVTAFNGGNTAIESDEYPNRRSELWFTMADEIETLDLDDDDQLAADLVAPVYRFDKHGRRVVEPKDETKKRLGRSPDRGDSVLMTLVRPMVIEMPDPALALPFRSPAGMPDWDAAAPRGGSLTSDLLTGDM